MLALVVATCAGGCATPPAPTQRTTVVLMPDEGGRAVSVTTGTGSQKIDEAYSFATVEGGHSRPSEVNLMGRELVTEAYSRILKAQPPNPSLDHIDVQYFGEEKPLIPSDSRALEPRNRRIEVMVL